MDFISYLDFWSCVTAFIPLIAALILFKKTSKTLRILSVFVFINAFPEVIAVVLAYHSINNLYVFHAHTIIESIFVCMLVSKIIQTKAIHVIAISFCILFTVFCIINAFYIEGLESFNFIPRIIEGLTVISFCVYFFYRLFTADEMLDLIKYPYFWLFSGWLIYFAGTFFLFNYRNDPGFYVTFPIIHSILNIFLNLVYTYTLWLGSRKSASL